MRKADVQNPPPAAVLSRLFHLRDRPIAPHLEQLHHLLGRDDPVGIEAHGGRIQSVGGEEATKEGMNWQDERLEFFVPELTETLHPLCPDLERRGDRLKGGNFRLRKEVHLVSVEEEAEIRRDLLCLPQCRRHHHQWPFERPGNFPQHQCPGTPPKAEQADGATIPGQI